MEKGQYNSMQLIFNTLKSMDYMRCFSFNISVTKYIFMYIVFLGLRAICLFIHHTLC